jgi:hypothetical protein
MKNKYGIEWLNLDNDNDMVMIEMSLMDNGDWEYNRVGVGMNKGKVFIVDLDDCNESWREVEYCDKVKSIEELLKIGVDCKVFEKIEDGYDESDEYRCNVDGDEDWDKFRKLVGSNGGGKLYSFMK